MRYLYQDLPPARSAATAGGVHQRQHIQCLIRVEHGCSNGVVVGHDILGDLDLAYRCSDDGDVGHVNLGHLDVVHN